MEIETQSSTLPYYKEKRQELIEQLGGECQAEDCDKEEDLQFHHVNPEEGHESGLGGWQHLYKIREDLENNVEIELRCMHHHIKEHRDREDLTPLTRFEA